MEQDNRESWLNRVAAGMGPLFETLDAPLPHRVRVAIGFTRRHLKVCAPDNDLADIMRTSAN